MMAIEYFYPVINCLAKITIKMTIVSSKLIAVLQFQCI